MTATLTLHQIGDSLAQIAETLVENGGELTPELADLLAHEVGTFEAKVERCLLYARNLESSAAAAQLEADRIAALASSRAKAAKRLHDYVHEEMTRARIDKIETPLIVARITRNSRPSIRWTRAIEDLDRAFVRVTVTLDGQKAYESWKANSTSLPEGFEVVQGTHLRVR